MARAQEAKRLYHHLLLRQMSLVSLLPQPRSIQKLRQRKGAAESSAMLHHQLPRSRDGSRTGFHEANLLERRIVKAKVSREAVSLAEQLSGTQTQMKVQQVWTTELRACEMSLLPAAAQTLSLATTTGMYYMIRAVSAL